MALQRPNFARGGLRSLPCLPLPRRSRTRRYVCLWFLCSMSRRVMSRRVCGWGLKAFCMFQLCHARQWPS